MRRILAAIFAATLLVVGCTPDGDAPTPSPSVSPKTDLPPVDADLKQVVDALNAKDLSKLANVADPKAAQEDFTTIFAGMDDIYPEVKSDAVTYGENEAVAKLNYTYKFGMHGWTYTTEAKFTYADDKWSFAWAPSAVHPELTEQTRLRHIQQEAKRGSINDNTGLAIVEERSLFEVGLDKASIPEAEWAGAAKALATALKIDEPAFQKKVADNGPKAFVVGATVRQEAIPAAVVDIKGAHVNEVSAVVGPTDTFAAPLLGTVGQPTQKMIDESKGELSSIDRVGLSGLQSRYDKDLRGVPGARIELVGRKGVEPAPQVKVLAQQDPSIGKEITLSLDRDLQTKAESVLAGQAGIATLVVLDVKTGGLLAAAQSPAAGSFPHATYGKYAPGSTFKAVSALAMLRAGSTASTTVQCPANLKVGSYTFGNYSGYPSNGLGSVSLTDAFKYSCNTAFVGAAGTVTGESLKAAGGSLGVGTDHDAGFTSYFGTIEPGNSIDLAASMIGQGQVTMSPLAMASVAGSVASGKTMIPWLVEGKQATSTAAPLAAAEAQQLQMMMKATVDSGTGKSLQSIMTGAKSGTAEWGKTGAQQTHAWMIAYNENYAVSAFVEVGDSGGTTAAPLIVQLFS